MPFISSQKPFSFSRYLNFCLDFLAMTKNGLIRKIMLISEFMTSKPGKQTIAIHVLPKGNQTMKFDQLTESRPVHLRNLH